jgi:hypothetical protein
MRQRGTRALLALAAAAVAAGLAYWLLRAPVPVEVPNETVSTGDTPSATAPVTVSPKDTPAADPADGPASVAGALVIPALPGSPAGRVALAVLREGQVVATGDSAPGLFRLEYPRDAGDAAPFQLRAEAPRRPPALVPLPTRRYDAGEVRLLAGLVYGGRLLDKHDRPVEGVTVDFIAYGVVAGTSAPSAADGAFLLPLPPDTNLQGLFGVPDNGWGAPPTLEPRARGRLFLPVEAKPEGLAGRHDIVLEERPVSIRLRILDEVTGLPVPGAPVSLWGAQDFGFSLPASTPFDGAVTDAAGIYAPLWPMARKWALLRVLRPGGRAFWTVLDRTDVEFGEPRDLVLPKEPLVLTVRCVEHATGNPVPGAEVVLGTNAGVPLSGTSDAKGEIRWALFPSDSFDPEPLEVAGWSAAWRDAAGNPRREADMAFRGPEAAEDAEGPSPVYAAPLVLRLGRKADHGVWIRVEDPPGAAPFRPRLIRGFTSPDKGYFLFSAQFAGPVPDAAGRPLWWCWEWMMAETADQYMPREGTFTVELLGAGRDLLTRKADRAAIAASRRAEGALVFAAAPDEAMTRSLLVVGPDGRPAAGALVVVLSKVVADPFGTQERERGAAGADGRVTLNTLDAKGDCRVAAWDPATGASGLMRGLDVAAPPERWRLVLESPREFRVRVRFAGDTPMLSSNLNLTPISTAFPMIPGIASKDGDLTIPACPVAVCTCWIGGMGPKYEYRWTGGPASDFAGKDVVLEKR